MSFFPDLFHAAIRQDGLISLYVRSNQNRVDEYTLGRLEIEPALDDDPTDSEWSGSTVFAIKRDSKYGQIRIQSDIHGYVVYRFSRYEIDILNAKLTEVCRNAPKMSFERHPVSHPVVPSKVVQREIVADAHKPDFSELLGQMTLLMQSEFEKLRKDLSEAKTKETIKIIEKAVPVEIEVPVIVEAPPKEEEPDIASTLAPSGIFIPSRIGQNLDGNVSTKQAKTSSALSAAEKLKKLKEKNK